eukprot:1148495-Pelagomonas_calceolata.AAC.2
MGMKQGLSAYSSPALPRSIIASFTPMSHALHAQQASESSSPVLGQQQQQFVQPSLRGVAVAYAVDCPDERDCGIHGSMCACKEVSISLLHSPPAHGVDLPGRGGGEHMVAP